MFGIPGSVAAYFAVDSFLGRRWSISLGCIIFGASIFIFSISADRTVQLICNCISSFVSNFAYGAIYTYTPEVFPTSVRGTAVGFAAALNRLVGIVTPLITQEIYGINPTAPLYIASSLFLVAGILAAFFPYETRGRKMK